VVYGAAVPLTLVLRIDPLGAVPTGTVTFYDGTTSLGTASLKANPLSPSFPASATLTISTLALGVHSLGAVYSGDARNASWTSNTINITVSQANTMTSIAVTPNSPAPTYGATLTLAATVADSSAGSTGTPGGTAQFAYSLNNGTTWINLGSAVALSSSGTAQLQTTALPAGTPQVRVSYSGNANFNASAATIMQPVNPKTLTVTGITAQNKPYDGTATATLNTVGQTLTGIVNNDSVALGGNAAGTFATSNTGNGKTVNITGLTLTGAAASNYTLIQPSTTASITKVSASVTPNAASKTYAAADPTLTGTLTGFIASDNIIAAYSRTPGESVAGSPYTISAVLSPASALANYNITYNTASFVITQGAGQSVTLQTNPAGLLVSVDAGTPQAAPFVVNLTPGSHTISVQGTQPGTPGTQYAFTGWSDAGSIAHSITVGASPATYTAAFQTQYQVTTGASPSAGGTLAPANGTFFNAGAVVSVQATANSGYQFGSFSGGTLSGAINPQSFTLKAPANVVANFTPLTPALAASAGTRTIIDASTVQMVVTLTNTAAGLATNTQIVSITPISVTSGTGPITVASGTGVNLGTVVPGGQASSTITLNWPSTATRASFTVNFISDGYSGSTTITAIR
jgi:hypothetical protein